MNAHLVRRMRGAAVIEFAAVAPLFFLVCLASVEFGRINIIRNTVDNAAYSAARVAVVPGATAQEAVDEARAILRAIGVTNASIVVTPSTLDDATTEVTVHVVAPLAGNAWLAPRFASGIDIASSATMLTERSPAIIAAAAPVPPPPPTTGGSDDGGSDDGSDDGGSDDGGSDDGSDDGGSSTPPPPPLL